MRGVCVHAALAGMAVFRPRFRLTLPWGTAKKVPGFAVKQKERQMLWGMPWYFWVCLVLLVVVVAFYIWYRKRQQ